MDQEELRTILSSLKEAAKQNLREPEDLGVDKAGMGAPTTARPLNAGTFKGG